MSTSTKITLRGSAVAPRPPLRQILLAGMGACIAIGCLALLGKASSQPLILGSFGASCVLLFGFPDAVFSRISNLVFGHLLSSLIGLCFLKFLGPDWWSMALAAATALMVMLATSTTHPPAGSNPLIIFLSQADWKFLVLPTLAGVLLLLVLANTYRFFTRKLS